MTNTVSKLNPEWITETRRYFLDFLESTNFPHPVRDGTRGTEFDYPEWLIMFIAVLPSNAKRRPIWEFIGWLKSIGNRLPKGSICRLSRSRSFGRD